MMDRNRFAALQGRRRVTTEKPIHRGDSNRIGETSEVLGTHDRVHIFDILVTQLLLQNRNQFGGGIGVVVAEREGIVRTVLSVAGPANVLVQVWLRSLSEVAELEIAIEKKLPSVTITDRSIVLAVRKRMGRIFDEDEMPQDVVPWEQVG